MLKGQVLKPWAHSSGVRVEGGRGESLGRKQAVLGHRRKPEGRWQEHHPTRACSPENCLEAGGEEAEEANYKVCAEMRADYNCSCAPRF